MTALIQIEPETNIKKIVGFYPDRRQAPIPGIGEYVIEGDQGSINELVENWNTSQLRIKTGNYEPKESDPNTWDVSKIDKVGIELMKRALMDKHNSDWIELIKAHNSGSWSAQTYCCLSDKYDMIKYIRQALNAI